MECILSMRVLTEMEDKKNVRENEYNISVLIVLLTVELHIKLR